MATRTSSCNCGQLSLTYEGPDPERISLCQCYECQRRTGSVLRLDGVLGHLRRAGPRRGRSRLLHRPHVSAADDLRLRGVRAFVGDEPLGPPDPALRARRNRTRWPARVSLSDGVLRRGLVVASAKSRIVTASSSTSRQRVERDVGDGPGRRTAGKDAASTDTRRGACPRGGPAPAFEARMRMRGLEPPRGFPHTDLNRARLPIPPHPRATARIADGRGPVRSSGRASGRS